MKFLKLLIITLSLIVSKNTQTQLGNTAECTLEKKVNKNKTEQLLVNSSTSIAIQKTYTFTHKFVMQIQSEKHTTNINYFLNNNENYIGSSMDLANNTTKMITVMDMSTKRASMFMEISGQKTQMSIPLDIENMTEEAIKEKDVKITPTGKTKTILNFTCHEYKVTGKDYYGNIWVTKDAGVSFSKSFYQAKSKKGLNRSWMSMINGLTMEMNITDTSKRKEQITVMKCIALEKNNLSINSNDYKKMM